MIVAGVDDEEEGGREMNLRVSGRVECVQTVYSDGDEEERVGGEPDIRRGEVVDGVRGTGVL